MSNDSTSQKSQLLIEAGVLLFLIGLVIGLAIPAFANPRMGLSSHLESILNGMFLVLIGIVWHRIALSPKGKTILWGLLLYGTFANMTATLLASIWGAGNMMPIAASGMQGQPWQELAIAALLVSLALAMIASSILILVGLRKGRTNSN